MGELHSGQHSTNKCKIHIFQQIKVHRSTYSTRPLALA